ncbi:helix-turn-helix domain-containing protein [Streptomyces pilosus]|uniref:helix-turn-helix domain-containing protein n=1 Tax=Streptomyces pilosus TaxID=28893 RepID=UPI0036427CB6
MSGGGELVQDDLPAGLAELVAELQVLFGSLGLSMRRYALRCHCDASTVSRYLNGRQTPTWSFVVGLVQHVADERGEVVSQEVMTHLRTLYRRAVVASSSKGAGQQKLLLLLEQADEEAKQAKDLAQLKAGMLFERETEIRHLKVQLRAVQAARAVDAEEWDAALVEERQRQEALRQECERLQGEARTLREELARAKQAMAQSEERCAQLERLLDRAEQEEAQKAGQHLPGSDAVSVPSPASGSGEDEPATGDSGENEREARTRSTEASKGSLRGPFLREYYPTGSFRRASPKVVAVLHYRNGGRSVLWPHREQHYNKPWIGRPLSVCEIALGVHVSTFRLSLPAAGGAALFEAEVTVQWEVKDPLIVAESKITDIEPILMPALLDRLRAVSVRYPPGAADEAWRGMRAALSDDPEHWARLKGFEIRAFVRLALDQEQLRREASRYQVLLDSADATELAFMIARDPNDVTSLLAVIQARQSEANQDRRELLRLLLEGGLLGRDDLNEHARSIFEFLADHDDPPGTRPALPPPPIEPSADTEPSKDLPAATPSSANHSRQRPQPSAQTHSTARQRPSAALGVTDRALMRVEANVRQWSAQTQHVHGPGHRLSLAARHDWAGRVGATGRAGKAADLYRELADDYARIHGPRHRGTLAAQREQARWARVAGRSVEAQQLYRELANHYRTTLGPNHRLTRAMEAACRDGEDLRAT